MGPEILSSTGAGVGRKAPMALPDSSSALDKFQSATLLLGSQRPGTRAQKYEEFQKIAGASAGKNGGAGTSAGKLRPSEEEKQN